MHISNASLIWDGFGYLVLVASRTNSISPQPLEISANWQYANRWCPPPDNEPAEVTFQNRQAETLTLSAKSKVFLDATGTFRTAEAVRHLNPWDLPYPSYRTIFAAGLIE